jgi:hypothetical protein
MAIKLTIQEPAVTASDKDEQPTTPSDVFDRLGSLRLRQTFDKMKTKKPLATVGIRKSKPNEWCYVHPDHRYEGLLFLEREGMSDEWFFPTNEEVVAELEALSPTGLRQVCIFWWINRKKNTFIWPVALADSDGRQNDWHASMYEMMTVHANGQWCRIEAGDSGYNPEVAENSNDIQPEWPEIKHFGEVLRVAFRKGRVVDDLDHALFRRLRQVL